MKGVSLDSNIRGQPAVGEIVFWCVFLVQMHAEGNT